MQHCLGEQALRLRTSVTGSQCLLDAHRCQRTESVKFLFFVFLRPHFVASLKYLSMDWQPSQSLQHMILLANSECHSRPLTCRCLQA